MLSRRTLIAAISAGAAFPTTAIAQQSRIRQSWSDFRKGPQLAQFVRAVRRMRANTDPSSQDSWLFWANVHERYCKHAPDPYFLAWHRAYLALFEQALQRAAGSATLTLPYWDYYRESAVPAEFTRGNATSNPLYHARENVDVTQALGFPAFDNKVQTFNGVSGAFETLVERLPHNRVHSLIGADMVTYQSPRDPIFWLHHANIDRLWSAWVAAGGGRTMPESTTAYWNGDFTFAPGLLSPRRPTFDTRTGYNYAYDDETLPSPTSKPAPPRPPLKALGPLKSLRIRPNFFALGAGGSLELGADDFTVAVPLSTALQARLSPLMSDTPPGPASARSLAIILDGVSLTEAGAKGGYFYKVFVNLPAAGGGPEERYEVGEITPFQINVAGRHAAHSGLPLRIVLPATDTLANANAASVASIAVSFVRVEGENAPQTTAIKIDNFRIEASINPVE